MKYLKIILCFALFLSVLACSKQGPTEKEKQEFIQITEKITEPYNDSSKTEKESISYSYEKPNDIFWQKAVFKDEKGDVIKEILRDFDNARFPIKESIKELGEITETKVLKYCPKCFEIEEETTYRGEVKETNKLRYIKYNYDNGYLVSELMEEYSEDPNYKNVDGNKIVHSFLLRFIPSKENKPKGFYETTYFMEKSVRYCTKCDCGKHKEAEKCKDDKKINKECKGKKECKIGKVEFREETKFNDEGYPVDYKATSPECEHHPIEEWYKIEKDGLGNVIAIIGFKNKNLDSNDSFNTKMTLEYNDKGFITKIGDYRYNPDTKSYDLFHGEKNYIWNDPGLKGPKSFICPTVLEKAYCFGSKIFSINEKKVEKYENGEKVIVISKNSKECEGQKPDLPLKKVQKITYKYKIISK